MKEEIIDPVLIRVKDVLKNGKLAVGQKEYIDLLYGDSLHPVSLIKAFCYDCRAWYADGIGDCGDFKCPLYSKMPYANRPSSMPARRRHSGIIRNTEYPMETRILQPTLLAARKHNIGLMMVGMLAERKMRTKKYPQEITQKEITKEERSIAMFDTAIVKYENEKKKEKKCKEPKLSESTTKV